VDRVLASRLGPPAEPRGSHTLTDAEAAAIAGLYRDTNTGVPRTIVKEGSRLRVERGAALFADSGTRLHAANGQQWSFARGRATVTDAFGRVDTLERVPAWTPAPADLAALAGEYVSAEAETSFTVALDGDRIVLRQRPDRVVVLTPVYDGAFTSVLGTVRFLRDAGFVRALALSQERVWQLRFERTPAPGSSRRH
jgi:hypothetical protein